MLSNKDLVSAVHEIRNKLAFSMEQETSIFKPDVQVAISIMVVVELSGMIISMMEDATESHKDMQDNFIIAFKKCLSDNREEIKKIKSRNK